MRFSLLSSTLATSLLLAACNSSTSVTVTPPKSDTAADCPAYVKQVQDGFLACVNARVTAAGYPAVESWEQNKDGAFRQCNGNQQCINLFVQLAVECMAPYGTPEATAKMAKCQKEMKM